MSVGVESQCYAECDTCGETEISRIYNLKEWKHKLRNEYGWSIGKVALCPDCRAKRERERTKCQ
ncbi:hypothetical protein [Candidatus Proelusimicrobium excrementi]|uniref:hypothetical protein n=1 Tax=Candidatus Proelusimicrobium excrementi TaxID=3416222 RepID=UPI003CB96777|nr:hypothetical protein [Elusimicrobiaceae bacterium]